MSSYNGGADVMGTFINPTLTLGASATGTAHGLRVDPIFSINRVGWNNAMGIRISGSATSGSSPPPNAYGLISYGITTSGTTNTFSGYFVNPSSSGATVSMALYADSQAVGDYTQQPPANGLYVSGRLKNEQLTASSLVATDASKQLTSTTSSITPTFAGVNFGDTTLSKYKQVTGYTVNYSISGSPTPTYSTTIDYTIVGRVVTIRFNRSLQTMAALGRVSFANGQFPSEIRPSADIFLPVFVVDNSVTILGGFGLTTAGGALMTPNASYFSAGSGGIETTSVTYSL